MPFCRYYGLRSGCGASSGDEVFRCVHVLRFVLKEQDCSLRLRPGEQDCSGRKASVANRLSPRSRNGASESASEPVVNG